MKRDIRHLIRIGAAPLFAIAVVVSVFTGGVVWVAVIGGILLSMVYTYARGGLAGGRQRNRNRNRNRNRGGAPGEPPSS
jgi:hypothetical protein